eukprot:COSAG06_NODE_20255_length_802_cov_1.615932_2_plen_63_part_01
MIYSYVESKPTQSTYLHLPGDLTPECSDPGGLQGAGTSSVAAASCVRRAQEARLQSLAMQLAE